MVVKFDDLLWNKLQHCREVQVSIINPVKDVTPSKRYENSFSLQNYPLQRSKNNFSRMNYIRLDFAALSWRKIDDDIDFLHKQTNFHIRYHNDRTVFIWLWAATRLAWKSKNKEKTKKSFSIYHFIPIKVKTILARVFFSDIIFFGILYMNLDSMAIRHFGNCSRKLIQFLNASNAIN